jgi:outer membrane protein OmpA-like peptidoglycan-associated protein
MRVYPLQRVAGSLLLTIDYTPQDEHGAEGTAHFDWGHTTNRGEGALRNASLIDTQRLVQYRPLKRGGGELPRTYSSEIPSITQKKNVTYRIGGFFPDPGPDVDRLSVDLQLAGMIPAVPISTDTHPAPGLVTEGRATSDPLAKGDVVVWPVQTPNAAAVPDTHDLVAPVAGGTVAEGTGGATGLVTANADVLFAFDSADLSPRGSTLVRQAATILAAKADPTKPVDVVGHTDAKGDKSYNQKLSERRAATVTRPSARPAYCPGTLKPRGLGSSHPVASNTAPAARTTSEGRALNRRVEIWYTPKQAPTAPSPSATATDVATTSSSPGTRTQLTPPDVPTAPATTLPPTTLLTVDKPFGYTPTVYPVVRIGRLSLVSFDITLDHGHDDMLSKLSSISVANRDLGDVRIEDPATKQSYLPAFAKDDNSRILCTYTHKANAGAPYRYSCYMAELPATVTTVSVNLGVLGKAANVSVTG